MRETVSLNGTWLLMFGADTGRTLANRQDATEEGFVQTEAQVPGNVELDLVRAGLAEDPFFADNVLEYEKYEYYNWLFEREFRVDPVRQGKQVYLNFGGINTIASIYLNGKLLAQTSNMLIPYCFAVTDLLDWSGSNTLTVVIYSAMNWARQQEYTAAARGGLFSDEMTRLRMPPHSFGWDIMPRLLSAGLWRSVELEYRASEYIEDIYLTTMQVRDDSARLRLAYTFKSDRLQLPLYRISLQGSCGDSSFSLEQTTHFCSNSFDFTVHDPKFWWPRGYGEQPLYDVKVQLWQEDRLCDEKSFRFGIRTATIKTDFALDKPLQFQALVNDRPIFIRGSNWVPLSALHSLDLDRMDKAVELAYECGCNALRCWGGNVYEAERFYELCDEKGILVWQDFSMACAGQPSDDEFARTIEHEATKIVKLRRNHACLLIWAGDNEVDAVVYQQYPKGFARYNRITREVLPRVVAAHDPMRFFLPSSPYMPDEYDNYLQGPEQHLWGPRDDFKGDFYRLNTAMFASEIGYHGCPAISSIRKFISEAELWPFAGSRQWLVHNSERPLYKRDYDRNELMAKQVAILFGSVPEKMEDFVFASQVSQAEAKKFFIEQFRMQKGKKTGILWWNILDGWPQISDAVADYYFTPKLAWHIIRRSQQDVQFMLSEYDAWSHKVMAVNDTFQEIRGNYQVTHYDSDTVLAKGSFTLAADACSQLAEIPANPSQQGLYLLEWQIGDHVFHNHYIAGRYPFTLDQFRVWVDVIAGKEPTFKLAK